MTYRQIGSNVYFMLVASLPHLPRSFEVARPPINRFRLEDRLRLLEPEDAAVIQQVQDFLLWDRQPGNRTDEEVIVLHDHLMATITNPLVRELVSFRMDVRTIVSGLRRRRLGLLPPSGVGQWVEFIRRHWTQTDFNLGPHQPWVGEVAQILHVGDPLDVERHLLGVTWSRWSRLAERYHFSFEAVILYLARWEIIDRWSRLDKDLGRQRFDTLIAEALHEYANLYS